MDNRHALKFRLRQIPRYSSWIRAESRRVTSSELVRTTSKTVEPIFTEQGGQIQEVPIDVSTGTVYLILFGTGFDAPVDATASSFRSPCPPNTSTQCEHDLSVTYAGPQAQFPGLDQVNVLLPASLAGSGVSNLGISFDLTQGNLYITIK